jgi:hypothetical protein
MTPERTVVRSGNGDLVCVIVPTGDAPLTEAEREMWEQYIRVERERVLAEPPPPPRRAEEPPTIHYSELPEDTSGGRLSVEWNAYHRYHREVGRLLAEGNEGRWVLIKGEEIVGIWDTEAEAERVRLERFLMQDVFMKKICTRERVLFRWVSRRHTETCYYFEDRHSFPDHL